MLEEPGNGLKVVPDALVKVYLHTICIVRALFCNDAGTDSLVKIFDLKLGSV
jgi:hypothetical protein